MLKILILILILIIFVIICCEMDRCFYINYDFHEYYILNFPLRYIIAIHNTIYRLHQKNFVYSLKDYDFSNYIMKNKGQIYKEFKHCNLKKCIKYPHNIDPDFGIDKHYKWIIFKFDDNHKKQINYNLDCFPTIDLFLKKFKNVNTCILSIMDQRKIIDYHRAPYSGELRCHFPIYMNPDANCYLEVMDIKNDNRNAFMFDHTHPHRLIKKDDYLRVILIVDIDNPFSYFQYHQLFK